MANRISVVVALGLVAAGYSLGTLQSVVVRTVLAQTDIASELPPEEASKKILSANEALKLAAESLKQEQRYVPATKALNPYGILMGNLNAIDDLEAGRGVDPITFAGLYAGDAIDEVKANLLTDDEGRLTYKGKVVRLYPISRLKKNELLRLSLAGEAKGKAVSE